MLFWLDSTLFLSSYRFQQKERVMKKRINIVKKYNLKIFIFV